MSEPKNHIHVQVTVKNSPVNSTSASVARLLSDS